MRKSGGIRSEFTRRRSSCSINPQSAADAGSDDPVTTSKTNQRSAARDHRISSSRRRRWLSTFVDRLYFVDATFSSCRSIRVLFMCLLARSLELAGWRLKISLPAPTGLMTLLASHRWSNSNSSGGRKCSAALLVTVAATEKRLLLLPLPTTSKSALYVCAHHLLIYVRMYNIILLAPQQQ